MPDDLNGLFEYMAQALEMGKERVFRELWGLFFVFCLLFVKGFHILVYYVFV